MKRIIVPTDFSEASQSSVNYSISIARMLHLQVTLFHVIELYPFNVWTPESEIVSPTLASSDIDQMFEMSQQSMQKLFEELKGQHPDVNFDFIILKGNLVYELLSETANDETAFVVTNSFAPHEVSRQLSKHANNVLLNEALCPILFLPNKAQFFGFKKIIFATNLHESDMDVIDRISRTFASMQPELRMVYINKKQEFDDKLKIVGFEQLVRHKVSYDKLIFQATASNDVATCIKEQIAVEKADLLVLKRENRSMIENWMEQVNTNKLTKMTDIPVVVFSQKMKPETLSK
jgi:nucleotide-binding universal stress UspA family protein